MLRWLIPLGFIAAGVVMIAQAEARRKTRALAYAGNTPEPSDWLDSLIRRRQAYGITFSDN